jgi:hypothetical protein
MDRTYIESQQIVARYLSGDLTVREARQFEKYCLENPEWVKSQPIPVRLKAKMIRKPGEELDAADLESMPSNTAIEAAQLDTDDDDEVENEVASEFGALPPKARRWIRLMGFALAAAVVSVIGALLYANSLSEKLNAAQSTAKEYRLRAPGSTREYRIKLSPTPPSSPAVSVGWPDSPELMELRIDMTDGRYNTFLVTVSSVTAGHIMQMRRVARDSNGELRLNINSSAFGPGEFDVKFDGYTWRGDTVAVGWTRLSMK